MRPALATRAADRLLGRAAAAKLSERACLRGSSLCHDPPASVAHANPAVGLCDLLSGVLDAVSAARLCERALAIECDARPQFAAALPFVGCHPLMGFMATEAMDVRSKPLPC